MRIRMKINYMATLNKMTVQEFILESILSSYNTLVKLRYIEE